MVSGVKIEISERYIAFALSRCPGLRPSSWRRPNPKQRYQENRPASILAYAASASQTAELVAAGDFRQALGKAGHQLQVVESANALRSALDSGHYDLVLADSQDGKTVQDASPDAFLLPVVDAQSPTDVRSAEQNYKVIIRAPGKNGHHLDAIQKALQLKDKRGHAMAAR